MATNIAINGMGRIGRMVLRIALNNKNLNVKAINASYPPETIAHLLNYDTTHGVYDKKVEQIESGIKVNGHEIKLLSDRNPEFNHGDKAVAHINAGAKKVLLTGPSKGGDVQMIVKGVNDNQLDIDTYDIFSNASCTTNCIGPVAKVLNDKFGIINGLMTTVHAITNDQKNIDNPHKDLRRARSCNESIIPTSTGAAKALKEVLPEVEGKLHGMALRVPTKNVSLVDLVVDLEQNVTVTQVNDAFKNADLSGVLDVEEAPLVSVDFNTNPHSAIIDSQSTMVMGQNKVKVIAWYDNEWGYSNRVVEVADKIGQLIDDKAMVKAI